MKNLLPIALVLTLALGALAAAPARADDDVNALLKSGHEKLQAKDHDGALADLNAVLEADPKNVYAHNLLGFLHHNHTGDLDKALEHYEAVIAESSNAQQKAYAHTMRGTIIFTEKWKPLDAVKEYNKALETYPTSQTFLTASQLFHFISDKGDFAERALKAADDGIKYAMAEAKAQKREVEPGFAARLHLQRAICLLYLKKNDEAAKELEGLEFDETAHYNLAQYHAMLGDAEKATDHMKKAFAARKTAKARNQLRDFVMRDHDFNNLRGGFHWRKMLEREKEE